MNLPLFPHSALPAFQHSAFITVYSYPLSSQNRCHVFCPNLAALRRDRGLIQRQQLGFFISQRPATMVWVTWPPFMPNGRCQGRLAALSGVDGW